MDNHKYSEGVKEGYRRLWQAWGHLRRYNKADTCGSEEGGECSKMKIIEALKHFKNDERGVASIFIQMIIAIFGFAIVYTLTYDITCTYIFNIMIENAPADTPQAFFDNINRFRMLYNVLPFVAIFGIIMWSYVKAQKREYAA